MKKNGIWIDKEDTRPTVYLVWHTLPDGGDQLIGLCESEDDMKTCYDNALQHFDAEELHSTEVPFGWTYFE
ncbi:hypothetical protein LWF01_10870 [Saxibacter everestensis]|uniref:DUF695 domain-containing protein n=1 Tax=Saxibacter everestensis TaxID=2909229 RepID=A0ABY8QNU3_9MICO|nr:hypothetical protein LWF01_10870 [Brevibacteriaceae bacterium ZFBP1038]